MLAVELVDYSVETWASYLVDLKGTWTAERTVASLVALMVGTKECPRADELVGMLVVWMAGKWAEEWADGLAGRLVAMKAQTRVVTTAARMADQKAD
jgi:hypothetical protein